VVHQGTYRKERGNQGLSYEIRTFEYRTVLGLNFHCDGPGISPCHSLVFSGMSEYFSTIRLGNERCRRSFAQNSFLGESGNKRRTKRGMTKAKY